MATVSNMKASGHG